MYRYKGQPYEKLERVLDQFPKYYINILLGDFSEKYGETIFWNQQSEMRVFTTLVMVVQIE
jgi:hypothetical protein